MENGDHMCVDASDNSAILLGPDLAEKLKFDGNKFPSHSHGELIKTTGLSRRNDLQNSLL